MSSRESGLLRRPGQPVGERAGRRARAPTWRPERRRRARTARGRPPRSRARSTATTAASPGSTRAARTRGRHGPVTRAPARRAVRGATRPAHARPAMTPAWPGRNRHSTSSCAPASSTPHSTAALRPVTTASGRSSRRRGHRTQAWVTSTHRVDVDVAEQRAPGPCAELVRRQQPLRHRPSGRGTPSSEARGHWAARARRRCRIGRPDLAVVHRRRQCTKWAPARRDDESCTVATGLRAWRRRRRRRRPGGAGRCGAMTARMASLRSAPAASSSRDRGGQFGRRRARRRLRRGAGDHQGDLAAHAVGGPGGQLAQRPAADLLVGLGQLPAHGGRAGRHRTRPPRRSAHRPAGAATRRTPSCGLAGQRGQRGPALPALARQEPLEAEPVHGSPDTARAVVTADGPGTEVTGTPASTAARTSV